VEHGTGTSTESGLVEVRDSAVNALGHESTSLVSERADSPIVSEKAVNTAVIIVASGLAVALNLFVVLSFAKPDAANILIPVMFAALARLTWKIHPRGKKKHASKTNHLD